jgi:uncharacterized ParB-like nuclease family protein
LSKVASSIVHFPGQCTLSIIPALNDVLQVLVLRPRHRLHWAQQFDSFSSFPHRITSWSVNVSRNYVFIHSLQGLWPFSLTCRLTSARKGVLSCPPNSVTTAVTYIAYYVGFATCSRTTLCQRSGCPPRRLVFLIADRFQHAPRRYSLTLRRGAVNCMIHKQPFELPYPCSK